MQNIELIKTYYSVPQNGEFDNFFVKIDGECLFSWGDNAGLHSFTQPGDAPIEERLKELPQNVGEIYNRMAQARDQYFLEWEKANGHDVLARDGRKDEFGADWVLLLN